MQENRLKISVLGDICPVQNRELFAFSLSEADVIVGNLECVLSDQPTPVKKTGPVLSAPVAFASMLKRFGFSALSLANNHIRDCGDEGVRSTITACLHSGMVTFGAGIDETAASEPFIIEGNGLKVAFLSFAEKEFNYIHKSKAGALAFDPYASLDLITQVRKSVDALIVLYHGGIEHYIYPSPLLQKKCRAMVQAGADVVLCQHSHCIGTREQYNGKEILYGQGNCVFGYRPDNDAWNRGLIANVVVTSSTVSVEYQVLEMNEDGLSHLASEKVSKMILSQIEVESSNVLDNGILKERWKKFCKEKQSLYLPMLLGFSKNSTRLNRILRNGLVKTLYTRRQLNIANNIIRCDSHREVIETILGEWEFD